MRFAAIMIGDEILSGKRQDLHLAKTIALLGARGLQLAYAHYVGDEPERITATLRQAFASGDVVFSFGGIGATPDDHTRQCAAAALGRPLVAHPQAQALIWERIHDMAREKNMGGLHDDPKDPDNIHRLNMGVLPEGAQIIPNPYNKIPGFSCTNHPLPDASLTQGAGGAAVHFVPGFPVMAWPMLEWVLDHYYPSHFGSGAWQEKSIIVLAAMEAALTPLMLEIEASYRVKVFSLPSVDHPLYGRHIELGVKGLPSDVAVAFAHLHQALVAMQVPLGPELVRG